LDGVQVVLLPESTPIAGLVVDSSGTVYDSSSGRARSGDVEYLRLQCPAGENSATYADTWTELSLESTPGTPEGAQLSVVVETETTNYTATELVLEFDWSVKETRLDRVRRTEYDTGHVRKSRMDPQSRRMFKISCANTTTAERDTLIAFFDARKGTYQAFDWTPPLESATIKVCFVDDKLGTTLKAPSVFGFTFDLQEVF